MARPPPSGLPRPTSLSWAAPQSQIPPPLPPALRQVSPERASTWFRRVARPDLEDGPRPAFWQRLTQLIGGGVTLGITGWMVGWMDFGEDEHCFSPLRRQLGITTTHKLFGSLTREEIDWANPQRKKRQVDESVYLASNPETSQAVRGRRAGAQRAAGRSTAEGDEAPSDRIAKEPLSKERIWGHGIGLLKRDKVQS